MLCESFHFSMWLSAFVKHFAEKGRENINFLLPASSSSKKTSGTKGTDILYKKLDLINRSWACAFFARAGAIYRQNSLQLAGSFVYSMDHDNK